MLLHWPLRRKPAHAPPVQFLYLEPGENVEVHWFKHLTEHELLYTYRMSLSTAQYLYLQQLHMASLNGSAVEVRAYVSTGLRFADILELVHTGRVKGAQVRESLEEFERMEAHNFAVQREGGHDAKS